MQICRAEGQEFTNLIKQVLLSGTWGKWEDDRQQEVISFLSRLQVFVVLGFIGAAVAAFRRELVSKVRSCTVCTGFGIQR